MSKLSAELLPNPNITLPERVLALVDERAKCQGESRSGLLARAVLDYIGRNKAA